MGQPIISELSRRRKLRYLSDNLWPNSRICEVGAGSGWFSNELRKRGHEVTTFDLVEPADIVGDINQWQKAGIKPFSFDAVVALEVIEHVDCLAALSAICKIDGLIMLSSPHPNWDWAMKILEKINLTQKRTSAHNNLTDFKGISMTPVVFKRPLHIHQVAIFRNDGQGARGTRRAA